MKEQFFSNKLHAFMFCLKIVFMCTKIEDSLRHQSVKLLIGASRTCMHNFFPNFLLSRPCIHKTWNFTLVLLVKVLLLKTTFNLNKTYIWWTYATFPCYFKFSTRVTCFFFLFIFLKFIFISHVKSIPITSSFTTQSLLPSTWSLKSLSGRNVETFHRGNIWCG